MDQHTAVAVFQEALLVAILVSAPMLGLSLIVGLAISVIQTTTSLQEQTLTFVPKIVAILLAAALFGNWMLQYLIDYTQKLWSTFPQIHP